MKLAYINAGQIRGFSTSLRSLSLAQSLVKNFDVEIDYIVNFNKEDRLFYGEKYKGVRIHYFEDGLRVPLGRFRYNPLYLLDIFFTILKKTFLLKKISPEIIHVFKPWPDSFLPALIYKSLGKPIILDIDDAEYEMAKLWGQKINFYKPLLIKKLENFAPKNCNFLTVASIYFFEKYKNQIRNIEYIPNGIFLDDFNVTGDVKGRGGKIELLYSGFLNPGFDVDMVIEIFSRVKNISKDVFLTIIGEGPKKNELEGMARRLNLQDSISFKGFITQNEVFLSLSNADILLFPQRDTYLNRIRCPLKIREYMASGKAIVASPVGEVCHLLSDEQLAKSEDEFVKKIEILIRDKDLEERLGEENRKKAAEFCWEEASSKLYKIYKKLI